MTEERLTVVHEKHSCSAVHCPSQRNTGFLSTRQIQALLPDLAIEVSTINMVTGFRGSSYVSSPSSRISKSDRRLHASKTA